jgi:Tfp pilus assembly protein PilF/outer membrane protein assembly factor BamD (BamD/ComL family)
MKHIRFLISALALSMMFLAANAQPGAEIELNKPKKYENRKLGSEKTGEKKFTFPRKVLSNTVTHYNYYFNANQKLKDVVDRAKLSFKDDYSQLLPYYNYSLDATAQEKNELDSVIYKCTAGILLHDLRNSWIDNMYLLLAKAYFFRKDFDSAALTLQYINFSFAPKEAGGYDIPIGSNASNEEGEFSISTKEKNALFTKLTSRPPSRNESFIWQIRNHIERNELPEAAGVIEILRHDPNFPERLHTDLEEVLGYWYYKQQAYDSAAFHLSKALGDAASGQEKARWEYLIAQMYQLANKNEDAVDYYNRSIKHTTDPVMDVYARLNSIRINRSDKKDYIQNNIDELLRMAKRDKYVSYRDIIYYAAATIELERNQPDNAQDELLKSVKYTQNNPPQRSQSFLLLGDLNYNRKAYVPASRFYDSVDVNILGPGDKDRVTYRKPALKIVAENTVAVNTQDSLQALAKMPAEQREAIIKKMAKQLRKEQGLKEEDVASSNPAVQGQLSSNLFGSNDKGGDFYFYDASQKSKGFNEFRSRWGQRPNVDNWRRLAAVNRQNPALTNVDNPAQSTAVIAASASPSSYEGLIDNIPLNEQKMNESNKTITESLFTLGQTFTSKLEDYPSAIQAYEELLRRFPASIYTEEALFSLIYAYQKTGDREKVDYYKKQLLATYPNGKLAQLIKNPSLATTDTKADAATRKYSDIYNLFIEGQFARAKAEKKAADSTYGNSYWTPQLLFIESIYYIKEKDDPTAIKVLTDLTKLYASNPMAERAKTMIDVLKRRKEIEEYLTNLDVKRGEERKAVAPVVVNKPKPEQKPLAPTPKVEDKKVTKPEEKVVTTPKVEDKKVEATPKTENKPKEVVPPPTVEVKPLPVPVKKDTVAAKRAPIVKDFTFVAADPQYVVVLLDKVDPVYASEAKNAFNRYNRERFSNQVINLSSLQLDERYHLVLEGPFNDANAAVDYIDKVKPITSGRIIPWLTADRYSFIIISNANLQLLQNNKDMNAYKQLLKKAFPDKF